MDILKVLATKNNAFGETVVSSIFNYLLDPYADHGFGSTFLVHYLETLAEHWDFLDKDALKRLAACQLSKEPVVRVAAEWSSQESTQAGRRIDSLLQITLGKKLYLIATEMKIYGRSSADDTQLQAYVEMLKEERARYLEKLEEGQNHDAADIICALVYMIPGDSKKGLDYAREATEVCRNNDIHGVLVIPWASAKDIDAYNGLRTTKSMEEVLHSVLSDSYYGEVSPADQGAVDIVRSLRNAAKKNFEYRYLGNYSRSGQFPDDGTYRDGLQDDQRVLLECFASAANKVLPKRSIRANPLHTSIGIPLKAQPKKGENNSLCRIMTVESYETGVPLERFVLQISKRYFEGSIDIVTKALEDFPIKAEILDHDREGKPLYHENGKENEPVYRITFLPEVGSVVERREVIVAGFCVLIQAMMKAYNA
jgi:hypothetical protein